MNRSKFRWSDPMPYAAAPGIERHGDTPRALEIVMGIAILVVFVGLRVRWVGHLLSWDEAMNLCSVRSHAGGVDDFFSSWIHRYPPLYRLVLSQLFPSAAGFAERAQVMSVTIAAGSLAFLYALNRRVFGVRAALCAAACLAVMPGAVFFDVWIKQDMLVVFFGLAGLLLFVRGQSIPAGVALGAAFLSKHMGAYYAGAIFLLWAAQRRPWQVLARTAVSTIVVAGWWYVLSMREQAVFVDFASRAVGIAGWEKSWDYWLHQGRIDYGLVGTAAVVGGVLLAGAEACRRSVAAWKARATGPDTAEGNAAAIAWPLALLIVGYVLVHVSVGKAPWYTMPMFPAVATVQGLLLARVLDYAGKRAPQRPGSAGIDRIALPAAVAVVLLAGGLAMLTWNYERLFIRKDEPFAKGCIASRDAAKQVNESVDSEQGVLITPMSYWAGADQKPCAVFTYYLRPLPVLVRPCDITPEQLVASVREYGVRWAMISPIDDEHSRALLTALNRDYGIRPERRPGFVFFATDRILERPRNQASEP